MNLDSRECNDFFDAGPVHLIWLGQLSAILDSLLVGNASF